MPRPFAFEDRDLCAAPARADEFRRRADLAQKLCCAIQPVPCDLWFPPSQIARAEIHVDPRERIPVPLTRQLLEESHENGAGRVQIATLDQHATFEQPGMEGSRPIVFLLKYTPRLDRGFLRFRPPLAS